MTNVHHCPACELRFRNRTELEYHWREDHPPPPGEQEQVTGGDAAPTPKPGVTDHDA